jgi:hypothetical protein
MAIKPITNPYPKQKINRAEEKSFRDTSVRSTGNDKQIFGKDFTKNYSITLKDIDTSMMTHLKNVMNIKVSEANEVIKVPVMYGNEERWKNVRKNGVMRDKKGTLLLPLIVFRRTEQVFNDLLPQSFDHDVQGKFIQAVRHQQWSKENRYDRFSVTTGTKPVLESVVTGMPDFVDCTYEFICMTNYIEQMNMIIETFLEHENTYFGDENSYRFLSAVEGGFSDSSEFDVSGERIVKSTFSMKLKGYVVPEFNSSIFARNTAEVSKNYSKSKVVFGYEGNATDYQVKK